ncbi:aldose 1-epimerase family protein [Haloimpatiens sp. FM7330]|uniref:aldose 1-epimerase family protein n=1 Tax=Haloimpatiens sp. FM7330 TaxID=3298610 RepID=UPI003629F658
MITKLENELLEILADTNGAELISIKDKKDNIECLWTADPDYWKRHAPILFPIVGKVKNDKYRIGEREFTLTQHGFARDREFELIEKDNCKIIYRLRSNTDSLKKYPYKFELDVEYSLKQNNLEIIYKVRNIDDQSIYFSIGAHPGFNCPLFEDENIEDYYLEFNKNENASREILHPDLGLYTRESELVLKDSNILKLNKKLFKNDALVFKNLNSNKVSLKSNKHSKVITMDFKEFPYLGIWSKPNDAPFICIEPWFGHADFIDFDGDYREKSGVMSLEVGKEFTCSYNVSIEN